MSSLWRRSLPQFLRLTFEHNKYRTLAPISAYSKMKTNFVPPRFLNPVECTYTVVRHKTKKQRNTDSDDEEEFDEGDGSLSKDSKVMKVTTTSLRTDAVLKLALGVARNKIEQLFYESKIRVNGKKILKKSTPVRVDYEIDVIKGFSPKNPEHILVSRVEVLNIAAKEESIVITVRRFKNLLIENYEKDPYKASTAESDG